MEVTTEHRAVKKFLSLIEDRLDKLGGELQLIKSKQIKKNIIAIGEFNATDGTPIIQVAVKNPIEVWLGTLMHECGHLDQWEENAPVWRCFNNIKKDVSELFCTEMNLRARSNFCDKIIHLELDADKRAVNLMIKYKIPIEVERYIRHSNLILLKWVYLRNNGKWPDVSKKDESHFISNSIGKFYRSYKEVPKSVAPMFRA